MIKKTLFAFLVIFFICLINEVIVDAANSENVFMIEEDTKMEHLDQYITYFIDEERKYTIDDLLDPSFEGEFKSFKGVGRPNFGYTSAGYWLKFKIKNKTDQIDWLLEIESPKLNKTTLYQVSSDDTYEIKTVGNYSPFPEREVKFTNLMYILSIDSQNEVTYYLNVRTGSSMQLALKHWELEAFNQYSNNTYLSFGLLIGISIVMALYNFFLYFSIRDESYLYYVLFVIINALLYLSDSGIAYQYLWPEAVSWNLRAVVFFMALDNMSALLFARSFLNIKTHLPRVNKLFILLIIMNALFSIWALFSFKLAMYSTITASMVIILTVIPSAILIYRKGYQPARIFILAWGVFLTGVFISLLVDIGIFPLTTFTKNAWLFTTVMEVVLLSLALGDKYNLLNKEYQKVEQEKKENQQMVVDNLKKVDKLKDEFLASTSHELRTPLNGIIGIAETLRDGIVGDISKDMDRHLEMIVISGKRLANLVNDILDFSKLKNNDLDINLQSIHLKNITDIVMTVCAPLVKDKNIKLKNQVMDDIPTVWADESRLQQILYNLIGNAIKYTEKGEVIVSAKVTTHRIIVKVSDTGHGIESEQLKTIFEPFHQENNADQSVEGTGIGLYVTKKLVELHQGKIYVNSKVGQGTTFYFSLLKSREEASPSKLNMPKSIDDDFKIDTLTNASKSRIKSKALSVLIADDEKVNLQVLRNHLVLHGYQVIAVSNGKEAIAYLEENSVNLVILDIMMPHMSGFEVCAHLRKTHSLNELPILMLTAKDQINDKITSFKMGANDYLTKPCDKDELLSRVNTLIQLSQFHHEVLAMNANLEDIVKERTKALRLSNEELNALNHNLQVMSKTRQELLQNIAHEIGTPLTVIQSYLQGLEEGVIDVNEERYMKMVLRKIKILNRLITDLTDLSNLEAGRFSLEVSSIAMIDFINQIKEKVETDVTQNNRRFAFSKKITNEEASNLYCVIDMERIVQVFTNITWNAIKHTSNQTGVITLHFKLIEQASKLEMRLSDNGEGIDAQALPHIFERFYKYAVSALDNSVSSGLGLAITKEIIDAHQGEIQIESEKGKGTDLIILLPVNHSKEGD